MDGCPITTRTGRQMAERIAEHFRERDVVHLRSSPLERAQETAAPLAEAFDLPVVIDSRVIEAANYFEGLRVSFAGALRHPRTGSTSGSRRAGVRHTQILARMRPAMRGC